MEVITQHQLLISEQQQEARKANQITKLSISMSEFTDYDNEEGLVRFANMKRKVGYYFVFMTQPTTNKKYNILFSNKCHFLFAQALPLSPSQSNFKVYCILVVQVGEETILIHGTNGEQGYVGGAICAERAALLQLSHHRSPKILKVIITTDSESPIAPGVLCREYLLSHATPDTIVVMANGESTRISHTTLQELYPCKYEYRHQRRKELLCFAENFASNTVPVTDEVYPGATELHRRAMAVTKHDSATALHPLQLAAGVLYSNGDVEVAWILKALGLSTLLYCTLLLLFQQTFSESSCLSLYRNVVIAFLYL
jgi:cytidine deaminase